MARFPYITYREEDEGILKYFILQKDFPHNIGVVATQPNIESLVQSTVAGYNLWIVFVGTLRGNFVAVYPNYEKDMQQIFDNMALWFVAERILKDQKRYEKFKIK